MKDLGKIVAVASFGALSFLPASVDANHTACKPEATRITGNIRKMETNQKNRNPSGRNIVFYTGAYDTPHLSKKDVECVMGEVEMLNAGYKTSIKQVEGGWVYSIMPRDVYEEIEKKSK